VETAAASSCRACVSMDGSREGRGRGRGRRWAPRRGAAVDPGASSSSAHEATRAMEVSTEFWGYS
jgi:hypothetical protein